MKRILELLGLFALLLACPPASAVDKPCEYCHTSHMGKMTLLNSDPDKLCSGCHAERVGAGEHMTGMSLSMVVKDLPLYSGKVACTTCHDPHSRAEGMLRKPAAELCLSCHVK